MTTYLAYRRDEEAEEGRTTEVWRVEATQSGELLGTIKWFTRWRQYAFFPEPGTVYNPDCLDSITNWTRALMRQRRLRAQTNRAEGAQA